MNIYGLTIKKFHEGLTKGEFKALEVAQDFYRAIDEHDKHIGAYITLTKDVAIKQAGDIDVAVAKGETLGPLAGVPIALKDNLLVEGIRATSSSKILDNYTSAYDAGVVTKLKAAGAVFLGKTNMDEFAMGSSTENSAYQSTRNPHDLARVPGGSSGGSAAAVASHLAVAALGSDTGGSIRQPAAFCGVVGMKPTYGAVSRHGLMAMSSSLDQIGPFAKTVEDAAIVFQAIAGRDIFDATSTDVSYEGISEPRFDEVRQLRIGIPDEYFIEGLDGTVAAGVHQAIKELEAKGMEFKKISLPHTKYALSTYYIVQPAEVSANLARYDGIRYGFSDDHHGPKLMDRYTGSREHGFGPEVKRRIILGTFVLSSGYYDAYYAKAQKVRALIKRDFTQAFKDVDVILSPVTPTLPFTFGEKSSDPLQMYLSDVFTIPANLAGLPAISIPVKGTGIPGSLPIGFQLIGKSWREADILGIGQLYEKL